jgi:hypothetical protein
MLIRHKTVKELNINNKDRASINQVTSEKWESYYKDLWSGKEQVINVPKLNSENHSRTVKKQNKTKQQSFRYR